MMHRPERTTEHYFETMYKQMYLKHNTLGEDIPLVIALKAMGLESDQEIIQLIGVEPDIVDLFSGSLEEPYNIGVYTQQQVLKQCSLFSPTFFFY